MRSSYFLELPYTGVIKKNNRVGSTQCETPSKGYGAFVLSSTLLEFRRVTPFYTNTTNIGVTGMIPRRETLNYRDYILFFPRAGRG